MSEGVESIFESTRGHAAGGGVSLDATAEIVVESVKRVRVAWPGLSVDEASFVAHVGQSLPADVDALVVLSDLHVADLYLARACVNGVRGAAAMVESHCRPAIARYLARLDCIPDRVQEITQVILTRALVATAGRPSALETYQGRSALAHFIGIAAQRLALDDRRAAKNERKLLDRLAEEPAMPVRGPEQSLLRERYRASLEAALRAALAGLTGRERVVMKLHLLGGVSTTRIGKMYQVNQATVSRWLTRVRRGIWDEVARRLRDELGLADSEVESLLMAVGSRLDIGLSSALGSGT